jgi:hypothetical protein
VTEPAKIFAERTKPPTTDRLLYIFPVFFIPSTVSVDLKPLCKPAEDDCSQNSVGTVRTVSGSDSHYSVL